MTRDSWRGTKGLTLCSLSFFYLTCCSSSRREVFSSVSKMTSLITEESKLIEHLDKIVSLCQQRGEIDPALDNISRTLVCLRERHLNLLQSPKLTHDPVGGFKLLGRLVQDWNEVTQQTFLDSDSKILADNIRAMEVVLSKWKVWPRQLDIEGASLGLIMISHVYDLFPVPVWLDRHLTSEVCPQNKIDPQVTMISSDHLQLELVKRWKDLLARQPSNISSIDQIMKISPQAHKIDQASGYSQLTGHSTRDFKEKGSIKSQCPNFSYSSLSAEDYLSISRIALKHKLDSQASRWFMLAVSCPDFNSHIKANLSVTEGHLEKQLILQGPIFISDQQAPHDVTQTEYIRLCRKSIQPEQSAGPSSGLTCYWHLNQTYIRYKAEVIHLFPVVLRFYDVISDAEIQHIKDKARERLAPSSLHVNSRTVNRTQLLRVSQTAWLGEESDILLRLSRRVGHVTGLDTSQRDVDTSAEPFQVVNYGLGGSYTPHEDSVRVARALGEENGPALRGSGDRLATWMFYLSDVQLGGATVFPILKVWVAPKKGSATFWYNLKRYGEPERRMVHAACPVLLGDKWVANKWIRETGQMFLHGCLTRR